MVIKGLTCPKDNLPLATYSCTSCGSFNSLRILAQYSLDLPTLLAKISCVYPNLSIRFLYPNASSIGFKFSL